MSVLNDKNKDNSYNENRIVLSESERERIIESFRKKKFKQLVASEKRLWSTIKAKFNVND